MILDIDAGNTRIKWRALSAGGERLVGASVQGENAFAEISRLLPGPVQRVRAACVRNPLFRTALTDYAMASWGVLPEFAQSRERVGAVSNAYVEASHLGVDRWLAILAAYERVRGACCVLDAGSALTLDFVARGGQHEGGYIVPGLSQQRAALLEGTNIPLVESGQWGEVVPGASTVTAIHHGILAMFVQWIAAEYRSREQMDMRWLVTGGDADVLVDALMRQGVRCTQVPELVLEGLSIALP